MKGHPEIIAALNEVLRAELTASQQYMLGGARMGHAGFAKLAMHLAAESLSEFEHARLATARVLFLDGLPDGRPLSEPVSESSPMAQFRADLALESAHATRLNSALALTRKLGDHGSADLLEKILVSTEEHVDWLETQLDLMEKLGEGLYLAQQM
ncbi:MAG: bacterioferritin [Deltaproteobacteria bacterium]|nr:bacterioferritin [Deltaproteobacteria bacterium]